MDAAADCPPRAAASAAGSSGGADSQTTFPAMTSSANTTTVVPKTKTKGKEKKGKKATAPEETHRCFHCQSDGARMCCSQCHRAWYCGRPCQKKHWKQHKKACVAAVAAEARRAKLRRKATAARGGDGIDKETCVICVGPVVAPVELPCGHAYCGGCLAELRAKKVARACPLCREELPPGLDGLYELAYRVTKRIDGAVVRGKFSWASLPAAEQEEIDQAEAMLAEAVAQGHARAPLILSFLLEKVRNDLDGAEAAYRAAIAADPGHANAHRNLGTLLVGRAKVAESAGNLVKASALYDEVVAHYSITVGPEHEVVKGNKAIAARLRAALA